MGKPSSSLFIAKYPKKSFPVCLNAILYIILDFHNKSDQIEKSLLKNETSF